MTSHGDSVNGPPDTAEELDSRPGRVERATALARRAGAWAERRLPGAQIALLAVERERLSAAGLLAGGIAYRLFLWLLPLGLVLAAIASFWIENDRQRAEEVADEFGLTAVATRSALDAIQEGSRARWYFLLVGVPLLMWFSAGVVRALRIAFSVAWRVRPQRSRRAVRAAVAFNGIVVGLAALSLATAWLREQAGGVGLVLTVLVVTVYLAAAVLILSLLPHADAPWTGLVPGAVLVAFGAQAIHLAVVLYLAPKLGRSSELYGALGSATVLLLWLYFVARLLVAAAFLNASLWERRSAAASASRAP